MTGKLVDIDSVLRLLNFVSFQGQSQFLTLAKHNYTPGIYANGNIVFAFSFVRSYVRSLVCS